MYLFNILKNILPRISADDADQAKKKSASSALIRGKYLS